MKSTEASSSQSDKQSEQTRKQRRPRAKWMTMFLLCFCLLNNYMDRLTLSGVICDVQRYYNIGNDYAGFISTIYMFSYTLSAPLFGYLGDRYNRRYLLTFSILIWSCSILACSFMKTYIGFVVTRITYGIGSSGFVTISPTIISDMFVGNRRSRMLALYCLMIPIGAGLGYIIGAQAAYLIGQWQWSQRITPFFTAISVVLIFIFLIDPIRGEFELTGNQFHTTSWFTDIKVLCRNPSFMLTSCAYTCVTFSIGALSWWAPKVFYYGLKSHNPAARLSMVNVSLIIGIMTVVSGFLGIVLGAILSQVLRRRYPRADPLICAVGMFIRAPFFIGSLFILEVNIILTCVSLFICLVALNLNWAITVDITFYVVSPNRRGTSQAILLFMIHIFGDLGSPYIIGAISENYKQRKGTKYENNELEFKSLQYAFYVTCFVEILAGILYALTSIFVIKDKQRVEKYMQELRETALTSP